MGILEQGIEEKNTRIMEREVYSKTRAGQSFLFIVTSIDDRRKEADPQDFPTPSTSFRHFHTSRTLHLH
jgi:hypothetical protein